MRQPRIIRLEAALETEVRRFLSELSALPDAGKKTSWVTITRTGSFTDPRYGKFDITRPMLLTMVSNFDSGVFGQDIFIDVAHKPNDGAAAKVLKLAVEGDRLRALIEWTEFGIQAVKERGFRYLSAEYHENFTDNEKGKAHGCVLLGAGLVIRPCIKRLDPIQLSAPTDDQGGDIPVLLHPTLENKLLEEHHMKWTELIKTLTAQLKAMRLSEETIKNMVESATKVLEQVNDETVAKELCENFATTAKTLSEQIGSTPAQVTLHMGPVDVAAAVAKALSDQAAASKLLEETVAGKRKILTDLIDAAEGLDDSTKKSLADGVIAMVGADTSESSIKTLAESQIKIGGQLSAAKKLADMGFGSPAGSVRISVDSTNQVKALQEKADQRMGFTGMADAVRYRATGGVLQEPNKKLAEAVLAEFDQHNGARLHAEHRLLSAGDGVTSDVSVPATFERTVIRESLYNLIGLQFVNAGTAAFSGTTEIPFSYRDTGAAGINSVHVYEGGSVPRAGVKQGSEEARIIPQKLAFEVSDELRYLTGNGQLVNWDIVAENAMNAVRIIGESTERLIFNELLNAADQFSVVAVTNEATGTGNGSKSIFPAANFPIVRPKIDRDLQGNQVGSTRYPVVLKVDGVQLVEWNGENGTQPAGTYFWTDYNQGEFHVVDNTGAPVAVVTTKAVVSSYSYTTNVAKFDTDQGSVEAATFWDTFLFKYGLRKSLIEDQRYFTADFGLMSGTVKTMIEQARSFTESGARNGTNLDSMGNLGQVKGVPNFKSSAPGLAMGDQRIIIGARNNTRFRMAKAWTMGQLQDQRDGNGRFTGKKEAFGDQFLFLHTPTPLKGATTGIVLFSTAARVAR